ncbi:chromate transporter [Treponema sp. UBA753]|uniref:chromate transporter n=1 Tax=Treponema sp. UBA753 TaxID=1947747 RepID=UPI0025E658C5|nr:chromate transporter [Treponema sp. UBA753]
MALFKELVDLFITFFKIGIVTFGGGLTMLPLLERVLINEKNWVSMDEILDYYSIAQTTPGIIAVNVATFVGHKRAGTIGGIFATLGMVTPSVIIITIIAKFISNFEQIGWVQKAMKGINAAVAALLTYAVFNLCKKNLKSLWSVLLFFASFASIYFFHAHTVLVVLSAAFIGAVAFATSKKFNSAEEIKK